MTAESQDTAWCTEAQRAALQALRERWGSERVTLAGRELAGGGALLVWCSYADGARLLIGVEPDGYAHS